MNTTVNLAKQKIEEILSNNGEFNICKSGVCFTIEFVNNQQRVFIERVGIEAAITFDKDISNLENEELPISNEDLVELLSVLGDDMIRLLFRSV